jgi:hypothetical protein
MLNTIKRELIYMENGNSNITPEDIDLALKGGSELNLDLNLDLGPEGLPPRGEIDPILIPCKCPQDFGQITEIDATTKGRIVKFSIKVNNLCRNKEYLVGVLLYKWVWVWPWKWIKVPVAEECKIAKFTGCENCGSDIICFELVIKEPLCSDEYIGIDIVKNYVNCCKL